MTSAHSPAGGGIPSPAGRPARRRYSGSQLAWAALFVLPLFSGVVVFYLWPILQNAYYSLTSFGPFGGTTFIGIENYEELLADPELWRATLNTLVYTGLLLLGIPIALVIAALINRKGIRFTGVYRVAFFLPYVAMPAAVSMVWRVIFNGDFGVLNWALSLVGVSGPNWLSTEWISLVAVGIVGIWISIGFNLIILSAGLKGIPAEMYEASSLDGARGLRQFFSITLPLLSPSVFFVSVMTVINGFQLFDLLYALMGTSNPAIAKTQSLVYLFFSHFQNGDKGYAAAVGVIIMLLVAVFTIIQFRMQRRWVNYV